MKLKLITGIVLTLFLIGMLTLTFNLAVEGVASPATTVYIDNPTITATSVGQTFTVRIRVDSVTNLNAWRFALTWNPSLLDCTDLTIDYSWFGPEADTLKTGGKIDNTQGYMEPLVVTFSAAPWYVNGSGPLASATFKAKATGTTNIHLAEVKLKDPDGAFIPANIIDVYTVILDGIAYPVVTVSNLTGLYGLFRFSDHAFNYTAREISFNVTGPDGAFIFCNVTIPKTLLRANATHPWMVLFDGVPIPYKLAENTTHSSLHFIYMLSTHKVQIIGTSAGPPPPVGGFVFPINKLELLMPYIGVVSVIIFPTVVTVIFVRRRKKK